MSPFPRHILARERRQKRRVIGIPILVVAFANILIRQTSPFLVSGAMSRYLFPSNLELRENPDIDMHVMNVTANCSLCKFRVHNTEPNSTPRDVVICNAIKQAKNCILFVKTLRTTGSKANCVFLVDSVAYRKISEKTKSIIVSCGGQLIDCGSVSFKKKFDGHNYCYVFASYFIERNLNLIDRVIICDMYDTVFQGDPFNTQLSGDKLNIVDEGSNFTTIPGIKNQEWLKAFDLVIPESRLNELYLCSGYIGGKAAVVLKTLDLYLQQLTFGLKRHDQAAFNFLYFSGILKNNGIEIEDTRENELVRHISFIEMGNHTDIGDARTIRNESAFASVVHHYYINNDLQKSILYFCPREFPILEHYLGRAKENDIKKIEAELHNMSLQQKKDKNQQITKKQELSGLSVIKEGKPKKENTPSPTRIMNDDEIEEARIQKKKEQDAKKKKESGYVYKRAKDKVIGQPKPTYNQEFPQFMPELDKSDGIQSDKQIAEERKLLEKQQKFW